MESSPTKRKAIALLLVVFVLGVALGGLGVRVWNEREYNRRAMGWGHADQAQIVQELTRDLALTPEQQKQLQAILSDTRARFEAIYEQVRPQYDAAREQGRDRIRAMLTPGQRPKFEAFARRLDEARRKKGGH